VHELRFNHIFYGGNALCYLDDVYLSRREEMEICGRIHALALRYPGFITGSYNQMYGLLQMVGKVPPQPDRLKVRFCGASTKICAIRPDGWVTPCEVVWELKVDNVRNRPFIDIWKKGKLLNDFRGPLVLDMTNMKECRHCEYQFICFGGHRCQPFHYPGGIDRRELFCFKTERKAR
jgi:radical SAM protein with 4Fe4S-binding SPASM domain